MNARLKKLSSESLDMLYTYTVRWLSTLPIPSHRYTRERLQWCINVLLHMSHYWNAKEMSRLYILVSKHKRIKRIRIHYPMYNISFIDKTIKTD